MKFTYDIWYNIVSDDIRYCVIPHFNSTFLFQILIYNYSTCNNIIYTIIIILIIIKIAQK